MDSPNLSNPAKPTFRNTRLEHRHQRCNLPQPFSFQKRWRLEARARIWWRTSLHFSEGAEPDLIPAGIRQKPRSDAIMTSLMMGAVVYFRRGRTADTTELSFIRRKLSIVRRQMQLIAWFVANIGTLRVHCCVPAFRLAYFQFRFILPRSCGLEKLVQTYNNEETVTIRPV